MSLTKMLPKVLASAVVATVVTFAAGGQAQAATTGNWKLPDQHQGISANGNKMTWSQRDPQDNQATFQGSGFDVGDVGHPTNDKGLYDLGKLTFQDEGGTTANSPLAGKNIGLNIGFSDAFSQHLSAAFQYVTESSGISGPQSYLELTKAAQKPITFIVNGIQYTVQLAGFGDNPDGYLAQGVGGILNQLQSGDLWAHITEKPAQDVPEPAAIGGVAIFGLYTASRYLRKEQLREV